MHVPCVDSPREMNSSVASLIQEHRYFGTGGALHLFRSLHKDDIEEELLFGRFSFALQYLSIVREALSWQKDTRSFLMRVQMARLVYQASVLIEKIKNIAPFENLSSQSLLTLLFVMGRSLEVLRVFPLSIFKRLRKDFLDDLTSVVSVIEKRAQEEILHEGTRAVNAGRFWDFQQRRHLFFGKESALLLLGQGLLYDLFRKGLYQMKDPQEVRETMWRYCMEYEHKEEKQKIVSLLFSFMGDYKKEEAVLPH